MIKYFDFEKGDIITYQAKYGPEIQTIINFVKKNEQVDTIGTTSEFLRVTRDMISNDFGEIKLIEVFRRYGDIYKKIY